MAETRQASVSGLADASMAGRPDTLAFRIFAWAVVVTMFVFLLNNYLIFWWDWPGLAPLGEYFAQGQDGSSGAPLELETAILAWLQAGFYGLGIIACVVLVVASRARTLRRDSRVMSDIAAYIIRASFWAVLFVGLADMVISFLRVEGMLEGVVGAELAKDLGRSKFRGPYVHMPLIGLALVVGAFARTLGFTWLALLVVVAELQIVLSRFIFSYEQAFMGDLVRFWYAALFLFASAYTLMEEGHVRVDVLYARFTSKTKGLVNAVGSVLLGMSLCWVVLTLGMLSKSTIINSPLLSFEVSQAGFGMYVKYLMAGFLAIFAISMMIQFASYLLESIADYRGEANGHQAEEEPGHHVEPEF